MMELFPVLELGWLNGWIMFALFLIVEGASLLALNRDVAKRLFEFDRSTWSGRQRASFTTGKLLALICIILFFLTPLKTGSTVFYLGTTTFVLGLFGLVVALHNFNNSPLDRPVAIGLYRFSRHPQLVALFFVTLGICIAIGSWTAVLVRIAASRFQHAGVIAEENECLRRFGDSYREYMENVPRYLLL
jgi:protein-S-isoprenylcysteine O-methyltransferase Ste14